MADDAESQSEMVPREAFGGAMRIALPSRFIDVSDFRPVPDNAEVYTDAERDESVILEVMEHFPDRDAARHYFEDLADTNDAQAREVLVEEPVGSEDFPLLRSSADGRPSVSVASVLGTQRVSKFREAAANDVRVLVAVLQVPSHDADVLLTFNAPSFISADSSSARVAGSGQGSGADAEAVVAFAKAVAASFAIDDFSLFASASDANEDAGDAEGDE